MDDAIANKLEQRLGRLHAKQRLGIEKDHEAQIFGQGINFFHIENWYSVHSLIRNALKLSGIFWRGHRNAERVQVRHNYIRLRRLPRAFNGFTLLHISDLHIDMNEGAMRRLEQLLPDLEYDICAITGDFRGPTFGPFDEALEGMKRLRSNLGKSAYGVLGNHDTIRMVPGLEDMGIRVLLNECEPISRGGETIYLAGIDDAHFYRVDNIEKAASAIPADAFSILLSHTPEVYRHAAHIEFDLLLSGHTHGGQICLPGSNGTDYPTPDGTCIRDYIHVSDLVRAHSDALRYLRAGGDSVTLNCGYGHGFSVREVIEMVKRVSKVDFKVESAPRRPGDPAKIVAASDRARTMLGWTPQYDDLATIIAHALAWEQKLQQHDFARSRADNE